MPTTIEPHRRRKSKSRPRSRRSSRTSKRRLTRPRSSKRHVYRSDNDEWDYLDIQAVPAGIQAPPAVPAGIQAPPAVPAGRPPSPRLASGTNIKPSMLNIDQINKFENAIKQASFFVYRNFAKTLSVYKKEQGATRSLGYFFLPMRENSYDKVTLTQVNSILKANFPSCTIRLDMGVFECLVTKKKEDEDDGVKIINFIEFFHLVNNTEIGANGIIELQGQPAAVDLQAVVRDDHL